MKQFELVLLVISSPVLLWSIEPLFAPAGMPSPAYEDVKSIFEENCISCHSGPKAPRGLQLTSYEAVLAGGKGGPVVVPGDPAGSELVKRIRGVSEPRMPLSGPPWLEEGEMKLIEDWIKGGAKRGPEAQNEQEENEPAARGAADKRTSVRYADVAPIFRRNCVRCHAERGLMPAPPENLLLNSYQGILDSRDRARVVPGNPAASELVRRIRGRAFPRMPFDGPPYLSEEEILLIETWVVQGAMDDTGQKAEIPVGARVRVHGRLDGRWSLDAMPLQVTGHTEIKKQVSPGDYVEVRGRVTPQGMISVERIRAR